MNVTTAIIPAAGFGTRMLPVTATVPKVLMPILDRPLIDYVVADCLAAGVKRFIFVITPGSHGLQDYYTGNPMLEAHLRRFGKTKALKQLADIHDEAAFTFVEQPEGGDWGTAVPVRLAAPHLPKNEAFIVCYGDAFLWREDGGSELQELVKAFTKTNSAGAAMGLERPEAELHRYGVLDVAHHEGSEYLRSVVEKPAPGSAPSNIINLGFYIFTPELLPYVDQVTVNTPSGEFLLTDAVAAAAQKHPIVVHRATAQFLDAGNLAGWLQANEVVAASRADLKD